MTYLNQLLEGKYGKILKKHRDLAEIIYHEQPDLDSIPKILEYAQNNNIDLIIISTHGRSGISRWAFGSVADKVVRTSTVPVLTVTPTGCRIG